jgi:hypothetical protein
VFHYLLIIIQLFSIVKKWRSPFQCREWSGVWISLLSQLKLTTVSEYHFVYPIQSNPISELFVGKKRTTTTTQLTNKQIPFLFFFFSNFFSNQFLRWFRSWKKFHHHPIRTFISIIISIDINSIAWGWFNFR